MFISHFDDLRRRKGLEEGRDLSVRQVAVETELAVNTLQKLRGEDVDDMRLSTLDILCDYFGVETLTALIEYVPDPEEQGEEEAEQ